MLPVVPRCIGAINDDRTTLIRRAGLWREQWGGEGHPARSLLRPISEFQKFRLPTNPNHFYIDHCPVPQRGVRTSRTRGGMRWTRAARETNAACWRTAKSCRSDAPIVGVKSAIRSAGDGVKKRGHRGEREVSRKTIARGMPG